MDKIQEITSKLYTEGVEKGKAEAEKIISDANKTRNKIIDEANANAEDIISNAKKEVSELKSHVEAELKLYAKQASEALKTEITNLVTDKIANKNVKVVVEDKNFMNKLIVELVQNWAKDENLTIGVKSKEDLESFIASNARGILDNKLKIEEVNNIKSGFVVSPEDGTYKVEFGEKEFIEYFKEFLRPKVKELLF